MYEEEPGRLLALLAELVARSGRPLREIERSLGVGHGWLRLLLAGRMEIKVRHICDLARELGFTPGEFFRQAYPDATRSVLDQVRKDVNEILPPKLRRRQLNSKARVEVREIFREELAKLDLLPAGAPLPEPDPSDIDEET